jgi:hypothetical protein
MNDACDNDDDDGFGCFKSIMRNHIVAN